MHPSRRCGHPAMPAGHVEGMKIPAAATVLLVLGFVAVPKEADAHGAMNLPRSRNMGRTPAKPSPAGGSVNHGGCDGASCMWFNQGWWVSRRSPSSAPVYLRRLCASCAKLTLCFLLRQLYRVQDLRRHVHQQLQCVCVRPQGSTGHTPRCCAHHQQYCRLYTAPSMAVAWGGTYVGQLRPLGGLNCQQ